MGGLTVVAVVARRIGQARATRKRGPARGERMGWARRSNERLAALRAVAHAPTTRPSERAPGGHMKRRSFLATTAVAAAASAATARVAAAPSGKTFVLVHGAWHGGWCWSK